MKTHYDTLEIDKTATKDDVKRAYRRMARKYHPDKNDNDGAEMKSVNLAYEVLYDDERRKNYDETGADDVEPFLEAAKQIIIQKTLSWLQTQDEKGDLIRYLVSELENDLVAILGNKTRGEAIIAKLQSAMSRLTYSGEEKDILRDALQKQVDHVTSQLSTVGDDVARNRLAMRIARDYAYRTEMATPGMRAFIGNGLFVVDR